MVDKRLAEAGDRQTEQPVVCQMLLFKPRSYGKNKKTGTQKRDKKKKRFNHIQNQPTLFVTLFFCNKHQTPHPHHGGYG